MLLKKNNKAKLPYPLQAGIENLTGCSIDAAKIHFNSATPVLLNAKAFTQGNEIHIAAKQEQQLPHEAWHGVQQKQGSVQPTQQLKSKHINDEKGLEKEADDMGLKAGS